MFAIMLAVVQCPSQTLCTAQHKYLPTLFKYILFSYSEGWRLALAASPPPQSYQTPVSPAAEGGGTCPIQLVGGADKGRLLRVLSDQ